MDRHVIPCPHGQPAVCVRRGPAPQVLRNAARRIPTAFVTRFRPRSILRLILLGFALAILPLVVALVTATVYVDRVTAQGQEAIYNSVHSVASSQLLVEQLTAMERNARQYAVLGDQSLLKVYLSRRDEFLHTLQQMRALQTEPGQQRLIERLRQQEQAVYAQVREVKPGPRTGDAITDGFERLAVAAHQLQKQSSASVARATDRLQAAASRAQHMLIWQVAALVPAVLALAALFIYLIAHPLRQLDHAIRRLGAGKFSQPITVSGPRDLEDLGRRLDWMRDRLLELENQKVTFLRHMSHELKTPLASIREGSDLLREQLVGPLTAEQSEVADLLHSNSVQLQRLIEDLLSFSISCSSNPLTERHPVQLHQLAEDVAATQRLAIRGKGLRLETELDTVAVTGDPTKLKAVMDNLLSNAVKYSPEGGHIWMRLHRRGDNAVLEVEDEGPGIPAEERPRVFEAFFQGRNQHKGHIKGTGLGLSIAREYAKAHHGDIDVADSGHGTLLRVTLPLAGTNA